MIPSLSWTPEFCLRCDKQCLLGSVYCTDECRELDLNKVEAASRSATSLFSSSEDSDRINLEVETPDSSEEDFDSISLWHSQLKNTQAVQEPPKGAGSTRNSHGQRMHVNGGTQRRKGNEPQFLYVSPTLRPTKPLVNSTQMSPLLIPQASSVEPEPMNLQSVSTYKRWLSNEAPMNQS